MAAGVPMADDAMTGVAAWAPNWHALVVHLPIGLLVSALVVDLVALLRPTPGAPAVVGAGLQTAGAVMLVVAFFTGRAAAPDVYAPGLAQAVVARHWDWGLWTLMVVSLVTTARLALGWRLGAPNRLTLGALVLGGLVGVALLAITADLGGRLVYEHGVGVAAPDR